MVRARIWFVIVALLTLAVALNAQVSPRTLEPSYAPGPQPLRVAVVGLEHGHIEGFLSALPQHHEVQLVGVADADSSLIAKYERKYRLDPSLFFKSEANMIEVRHPQAVLVYTSIVEHRHAIEIAAQYGVSVMVEKPLTISLDDASPSAASRASTTFTCW